MNTSVFSVGVVVQAVGTLTSTGVNVTLGNTVTINGIVYTFVTTPAAAYEVKRGASAAASLVNLKSAINADPNGLATGLYGRDTEVNPYVAATTIAATTLLVQAKQYGVGGNSITTTEVAATLSWGAATLASGAGTMTTVYAPTWGRNVQIVENLQAASTDFVFQQHTDDWPLYSQSGDSAIFYKGMRDQQFRPGAIAGYVGALTAGALFTAESGNNSL